MIEHTISDYNNDEVKASRFILKRKSYALKFDILWYPSSYYMGDLSVHYFTESTEGDWCSFSNTGKCRCYDVIRYGHLEATDDKQGLVIDLLTKALTKENLPLLSDEELLDIFEFVLPKGE